MRLAGAIDGWPFRQDDDLGPGARVTTPTTAVAILVHRDIANATVRRAVVAALPRVLSEDWTEAAHQIRAAAECARPPSSEVGRDAPGPDPQRVIAIALPEAVWELATDYHRDECAPCRGAAGKG